MGPDYLTIGASGGPGLLDHCHGRKLGKMRRPGKANPAVPDARDEFADGIHCDSRPRC